jgi:hypothetical protein
MRIWLAAIAAIVVQPFVFAVRLAPEFFASSQPLYGIGFVLLSVVVVAAAVVFVLGVPAFMLLRKYKREGWLSLAVSGFLLGALPLVVSWPRNLEGYSSGYNWHGKYHDFYVNGAPTSYAWLNYAENVMYYGIHGLIGALVFYAVWRRLTLTHHSSGTPNGAP